MDRFEHLPTEALADAGEQAPTGAGLAAAAARRAQVRRRRRVGAGAIVVAALIVLAMVVPATQLHRHSTHLTPSGAPEAWRTVHRGDVMIDLPARCVIGPVAFNLAPGSCHVFFRPLRIHSGTAARRTRLPSGQVVIPFLSDTDARESIASLTIDVTDGDRSDLLRIVGSARTRRQAAPPDLSGGWQEVRLQHHTAVIPTAAGVGRTSLYGVVEGAFAPKCVCRYFQVRIHNGRGPIVTATAPTPALAATMAATVRPLGQEWTARSRVGVSIDLPTGCSLDAVTPEPCRGLTRIDVDPIGPTTDLIASGFQPRPAPASGLVTVTLPGTDGYVFAVGSDPAVVRRVVASARPAGTPSSGSEDQSWRAHVVAPGIEVEVPTDQPPPYGASLVASSTPVTLLREVDGVWRAVVQPQGHDVRILVREPTEALAELVAASIRHPESGRISH